MTPLETLQKYGLKTDVKSIHARMNNFDLYYQVGKKAFPDTQVGEQFGVVLLITKADQDLLCSLAEKGKRYEKAVKDRKQEAQRFIHTMHEFYGNTRFWGVTIFKEHIKVIDKIITEAEGKGK